MVGYRLLVALLLAAPALHAVEATLPDPSFETDKLAWTLTCEEGAVGTVTASTDARTGQRSLKVEKTNGLGYLLLTAPAVAVPAKTPVEASFWFKLARRDYGARMYFVNIDQDAAGKAVGGTHYPPHYDMAPRFNADGGWQKHAARWTTEDTAAGTVLRLVIAGNPITLTIDDAAIVANPPDASHPGKVQSSEPPFDEARARANLAKRVAEPGSVGLVSGHPVFRVGDYRSAQVHQGSFWAPSVSKYAGFGQAGIHLQTISVQLGPLTDYELTVWKWPNGFDFSHLEHDLLQAVGADPDVHVILLVRCDAPKPWTLQHLDQVWTAENGQHWICPDAMHPGRAGDLPGPKETLTASYGAPAYLDLMSQGLTELGGWLKTHDVGKLVAGFMIGGATDGQFMDGSVGHQLDHSAGHQEGFRLWLRRQYRDEAALRQAWGDPNVTFANATVAPEAARKPATAFVTGLGMNQRVADSNHYDSVAPALTIKRFGQVLKTALGRPAFTICYWADAVHDQGDNRYALTELLAGPDRIDCAATVQEYAPWRMLGDTGAPNGCWAALRLRGAVPLCELDYRTYLASMNGEWGPDQLGATITPEGFRAQIRRDLGAAATRGSADWFYDMGGVWYDDPPLWATIREGQRTMAWAHRPEAPAPTTRMAAFVDEEAGWRVNQNDWSLLNSATNAERRPLNLSGVPYDLYLLDDIRNPKLPEYQAYLFLSAFCLTPEQMQAIRQKCLRPGKLVAFPGTPGLGTVEGPVATMQALTGLKYSLRPTGAKAACMPVAGDPLATDPADSFVSGGTLAYPALVPTDPAFKVFGRFTDDQTPSHGVARTPRGTIVQCASGLTPELIHNLAMEAGIKALAVPGQATYFGSGVAVAHRLAPGPVGVTFDRPVDLIDPADGTTVLARGVTEWEPDVKLLDTALVYYR